MQVQLSHPARTVDVKGPKRAKEVLRELNLVVEAHLVIRGDELVTEDEMLSDKDQIEIRPVISGGTPQETAPAVRRSSTSPSGRFLPDDQTMCAGYLGGKYERIL